MSMSKEERFNIVVTIGGCLTMLAIAIWIIVGASCQTLDRRGKEAYPYHGPIVGTNGQALNPSYEAEGGAK